MKLYLFELGNFIYPDAPKPIPVPGYLIQTENGRNILVDIGFPEKFSNMKQKKRGIPAFSVSSKDQWNND
jgi:hypothetical protein